MTAEFPDGSEPYPPPAVVGLIPNASRATLRTLLNHSCSVYDYRDEAFTSQLLANPFTPMREEEQLEAGLRRGLQSGSAPSGCETFYSNSNYVVLGMVLDRLYGEHHSTELHRLLSEMGLHDTYYEKHFQMGHYPDLERLSHSYVALPGLPDLLDAT